LKIGIAIITFLLLLTLAATYFFWPSNKIDYSTQVKPILNKKCITCHGGVKREADFSLLFRQEALAVAESGKKAIVPGDPNHSELIRRINETDPEERMPYKKDPLSKEEINILTRWIKEGAEWGDHWAYLKVEEQKIPDASTWAKNEVDHFIEEKFIA
jgi:Planctomycete cytochrome C